MIKAHVVREQEHSSRSEFIAVAAIIELPGIGIPMIEMTVLDGQDFAIA